MIRYAISLSLLVLILSASSSAQPSCERGFSAPTRIITAGGIPAAVYGDFNEDGQVDVAFTSTYRPTVALNRGNGVFEPIGAVQNFLDEPLIASADVTGDHHLDLVFGRYTVTWIARGRGDGTFTKPERVALFNATQSNGRLLDFDYDGILDVVEPGRDEVSFGRGRGNGTFEPFFRVEFEGTARLQRNQVTVGDFDGDGQIDALRTAQDLVTFKDRVSIVWSAATSARSQTDFTLSFPLINVTGATVDLDGDGGDDLLALSNSGLLALRFPARQLAQQAIPFPSKPTQPPSRPLVVDINGDGLRDFIFQYGSSAAIARGSATGQFEEPKLFGLVGGGGFALADIDGDGALDIATTAGEEGLSFIPGGRSLFDERPLRPILPLEFLSYQIQLADIDGDGLLDAVASDRGSMMVSVWLNRGAGKFKSIPAVRYAPQGYEGLGTRVFIADYDGDGRLDLAVSASEGTIAGPAIAFGNGDGTFTRVATELTGHFTGALRTSDLPGAAVLTIREGDLRAVRVSATGTVTTTTLFPAPEGTTVITFDLDDDGF
ncbi:MAG TPA: VCBS repeat-containing protein, partial [Thermoanaerobaculia bacterium]